MKQHGYIAVSRGVFTHRLFCEEHSFSRREAWLWMIAKAAWRPGVQRVRKASIGVVRGDFAASVRDLAEYWRWSKSSVHRFLISLRRERMIMFSRVGTKAGTHLSTTCLVITICNYNKFQDGPKFSTDGVGQYPGQDGQQAFLFSITNRSEPSNQSKIDIGVRGKRSGAAKRARARHGQASKHGTVFIHNGTDDWNTYAADYKSVHGVDPTPDKDDGFWFKPGGETPLPSPKRGFA